MPSDKPIPSSLDAEEAVIGSLLLDRDAIMSVADFLKPEHFYLEKNRWIYQAVYDLYQRRVPPDIITLSAELQSRMVNEKQSQLDVAGGLTYLAGAMNRVPTSVHVVFYSQKIW